jgi:hypothetical protein
MEKINYCLKCNHKWKQRGSDKPKKCPCCTNPNWNRRSSKEIIDYIVG